MTNDKCIECENETLLKLADLEMDFESLKQYHDATEKDIKKTPHFCEVIKSEFV